MFIIDENGEVIRPATPDLMMDKIEPLLFTVDGKKLSFEEWLETDESLEFRNARDRFYMEYGIIKEEDESWF